jgi:peptidyl-prolyl cis-trans isomerase A (cyclophilin A)
MGGVPGAQRVHGAARRLAALLLLGVNACAGAVAPAEPPTPAIAPELAVAPDSATLSAADSVLVRFVTSKGDFDVMLRKDWAPLGAARVGQVVASGYYDGARFFRALRGFVVQWGIPADTARRREWSARLADDPVRESNHRGTITFAAGGANTRTAQLFVSLRDNARLDAMGFAPVGSVVRGMDVVDALHTGYGEGGPAGQGPAQGRLAAEGEAYLATDFPLLDRIVRARVVRVFAPAPR